MTWRRLLRPPRRRDQRVPPATAQAILEAERMMTQERRGRATRGRVQISGAMLPQPQPRQRRHPQRPGKEHRHELGARPATMTVSRRTAARLRLPLRRLVQTFRRHRLQTVGMSNTHGEMMPYRHVTHRPRPLDGGLVKMTPSKAHRLLLFWPLTINTGDGGRWKAREPLGNDGKDDEAMRNDNY